MSRKLLIVSACVLSLLGFSLQASTADATSTIAPNTEANSSEMSKDSWLGAMKPMLPDLICKGFMEDPHLKQRFDEMKMTYEQCVGVIPASADKCQNQIYAKIPAMVNSDSAGVWGKALGECIGKDFAEQYLIPKS